MSNGTPCLVPSTPFRRRYLRYRCLCGGAGVGFDIPLLSGCQNTAKKGDKTTLNIKLLISLQHPLEVPNAIHHGYTWGIGKATVHFLCVGTPVYKSPDKQESARYVHVKLRYFSRNDRKLTTELRNLYLYNEILNISSDSNDIVNPLSVLFCDNLLKYKH